MTYSPQNFEPVDPVEAEAAARARAVLANLPADEQAAAQARRARIIQEAFDQYDADVEAASTILDQADRYAEEARMLADATLKDAQSIRARAEEEYDKSLAEAARIVRTAKAQANEIRQQAARSGASSSQLASDPLFGEWKPDARQPVFLRTWFEVYQEFGGVKIGNPPDRRVGQSV
ncbi:hypothetical protein E1262_27200 [Jiangella aurantiaca]|uniref:Uncharacterized protein n=1 Tax=Jiangella aurantiaca TaxID=2530373 RepID=A0A4R4ZZ96_9ACTN|nr:hypothetical protein [Jiangella aurantiaca]TDD64778.1 hypothetical protein E1262_27200 [Jiangella aurantiaca]